MKYSHFEQDIVIQISEAGLDWVALYVFLFLTSWIIQSDDASIKVAH